MEKYGSNVTNIALGGRDSWPRWASKWWKDLVRLEDGEEKPWFKEEVVRKVGNGLTTRFWKVAWIKGTPFMLKYLRLFSLSNQQEATVDEMRLGGGVGG